MCAPVGLSEVRVSGACFNGVFRPDGCPAGCRWRLDQHHGCCEDSGADRHDRARVRHTSTKQRPVDLCVDGETELGAGRAQRAHRQGEGNPEGFPILEFIACPRTKPPEGGGNGTGPDLKGSPGGRLQGGGFNERQGSAGHARYQGRHKSRADWRLNCGGAVAHLASLPVKPVAVSGCCAGPCDQWGGPM